MRPGSPVLVVSTGFWGDRWAEICSRLGLRVHKLRFPAGIPPDPIRIRAELHAKRHVALLVTHVDSSSGVVADLAALGEIARDAGVLTIVDGICAAGVEKIEQTLSEVDVYLTSTPKGLGVPAGLILISAGADAVRLLDARDWTSRSFALDLKAWLPVMEKARIGHFDYFQSPAGNLVLALCEGLRLLTLAEGLSERYVRHRKLAGALQRGLEALGIKLLVKSESARANGVTVCYYPDSLGHCFVDMVAREGTLLVCGLYPSVAKQTFRIGHLGNVTATDISDTLRSLERALGRVSPASLRRLA